MIKNTLKEIIKIAALGSVLIVAQVFAFSEPGTSAPGGTALAPVNVGGVTQEKTGGLIVAGLRSRLDAFLATDGGNVGIGTVSPAQKLHVAGGKAQADDFCLNSNPAKCLSTSPAYTGEYCWGNPQPSEVAKFGSCSPGGTPSPGVQMIHSSQGVCFLTYYVDGSNGGASGVFISSDGYWYLSGGWPAFSHRARCI